ncbi:hypothetical protein [Rhodovulum adriaticum]|uniref:Hsp70 protein n=1 Tax=Rhodovulum adriaticum TaxID=35804 RepID=A0A4R2NG89_RHOAD|nr:hypothetical protein EV656_12115 [Rhodovulum adriaticum]
MTAPALALDFGTSNSAAALLVEGKVHRLPIEADADTLPTAVFLPSDGGPMQIGRAAEAALIGGEDGRYMRALKSVFPPSMGSTRSTSSRPRTTLTSASTGRKNWSR